MSVRVEGSPRDRLASELMACRAELREVKWRLCETESDRRRLRSYLEWLIEDVEAACEYSDEVAMRHLGRWAGECQKLLDELDGIVPIASLAPDAGEEG